MTRTLISRLSRTASAVALLFSLAAVARADPAAGKQTPESLDLGNGSKMGYQLYLPENYGKDPAAKVPVIIFLHGSGEAGDGTTQLDKVKVHGPPKVAPGMKDFPFVVASPQNPPKQMWKPADVKALTGHVLKTVKGTDPDRVYLTGLSLGGFGTWLTAAAYPDTYAAIAPVCGGGRPDQAAKMKDLPIWVFHGDKDTTVPPQRSIDMVDALKAAGAKDVEFTRYPDKAHDSWTVTYANPKLYEWMLKHSKSDNAKKAAEKK